MRWSTIRQLAGACACAVSCVSDVVLCCLHVGWPQSLRWNCYCIPLLLTCLVIPLPFCQTREKRRGNSPSLLLLLKYPTVTFFCFHLWRIYFWGFIDDVVSIYFENFRTKRTKNKNLDPILEAHPTVHQDTRIDSCLSLQTVFRFSDMQQFRPQDEEQRIHAATFLIRDNGIPYQTPWICLKTLCWPVLCHWRHWQSCMTGRSCSW